MNREQLLVWFDGVVKRAVPDNHEEYTVSQLRDRIFEIMFDGLDEKGCFKDFPEEQP